jgi:hypothetical protein
LRSPPTEQPSDKPGHDGEQSTDRFALVVELADRLNKHRMEESETSITGKLARGTFAASFFLACLAVPERDGVRLEEI